MRIAIACVALLLAGCAKAPLADAGAAARPTMVSLNPCTDAILAELAGPDQLLALSDFSRDPASSSMDLTLARRFPATAGTVEEIAVLKPDLVVASTFTPPATRAALARLGIRLEQVPIARDASESVAQVRRLATLTGQAAKGEALVARIAAALAQAAPPPGSASVSAVVWQSGGIVPGEDTLIADLLRRTGFIHFSAARGMKQADVLPLEEMLADPPRVILAAGDPRSNEDRLLAHPALRALRGTRRERFDPSLLGCGGPTIVKAAARLASVRRSL